MVFTSPTFLFLLLPLALAGFFALPRDARSAFLVAISLVFYAWGEGWIVIVLAASVLLNWAIALRLEPLDDPRARGRWLAAAVLLNIGALVYFKYTNFLVANVAWLCGIAGVAPPEVAPVHLPIGVSFITFEALSYVIDVHRREARAARNPLHVAFYVSFFPHLIAGPILRFRNVAPAVARPQPTLAEFDSGISRFIAGLAKKVLLANPLGRLADPLFALTAAELSAGTAWLAVVAYALQLYFDFSGYSDMAIGMGRMFGFELPENFRTPYAAESVRDFWRRWHISLSAWFRDYLFIPLGGSRGERGRTLANLFTVFLLCGLWHGASWHFAAWGAFHGAFLVLERLSFGAWLARAARPVRHAYTMAVVLVGWVFFRAEDFGRASGHLLAMAGFGGAAGPSVVAFLRPATLVPLIVAIPLSVIAWPGEVTSSERDAMGPPPALSPFLRLTADLALFALSLTFVAGETYQPFIYFRF